MNKAADPLVPQTPSDGLIVNLIEAVRDKLVIRQGAELLVRSTLKVGLDNALERRWRRGAQSLGRRHPIPDAPLGEDISGVVRMVSQLAAQPLHDGAHRAGAARLVMTPHLS